ncbi:MAG: hypothetical protein KGI06_00890 [Candidatus Micrarchaeota archaeon]|nr:hypothetical protein [Candidatus Micrarchaeota archaeon]
MGSEHISERELERCIDSMVDEMSRIYCADLTEEAMLDSRMSDIGLRDSLISQIKEAIRCKKISERMMSEQSRKVSYKIDVEVGRNGMSYTVARSSNPPE